MMRDKLDGLSDILIKLSRVPGLAFLEDHGESLIRMKHTVEGHISDLEAKKQGVEEGAEVLRDSVRRKPKQGADRDAAIATKSQVADSEGPRAGKVAANQSTQDKLGKRKATSTAKLKQKLVQRKLKRR